MKRTRILLADQYPIFNLGLSILLQNEADFEIVGNVNNGLDALQLSKRLQPNVLILEVMLPKVNGLGVARQILSREFRPRVIFLTDHASEATVAEAFYYGASAYLLKTVTGNDLVKAIRAALAGCPSVSPPLSRSPLQKAKGVSVDHRYESLTHREHEVMRLIAEGMGNHEIATRLKISPRTLEIHRGNVMRKLQLRNAAQVVHFAIASGVIIPESKILLKPHRGKRNP